VRTYAAGTIHLALLFISRHVHRAPRGLHSFPTRRSSDLVTRGLVYRDGRLNSWQVDNQLVGHWFADNWENTLQFGLDYQKQDLDGQRLDDYAFGQPLNMFDPEYGHFTPVAPSQLQAHSLNSHQT